MNQILIDRVGSLPVLHSKGIMRKTDSKKFLIRLCTKFALPVLLSQSVAQPANVNPPVSYIRFVEDLVGTAMSLETFSGTPAAWKCCMRASMRVNDKTLHPICDLVETADLDAMEKPRLIYIQLDQMRKAGQRRPQGRDQNDFAVLSGSKFLNNLV